MAHTGSSVITSQQEVLEVGPSDFHVRYLFYEGTISAGDFSWSYHVSWQCFVEMVNSLAFDLKNLISLSCFDVQVEG